MEHNGQGLMLKDFREVLEGKKGSLASCALKICKSALIISKTQKISQKSTIKQEYQVFKLKQQCNFEPVHEVQVGLISQNFIKDSGSQNIIAPIISFRIVKKQKQIEKIQKMHILDSSGSSLDQKEDIINNYELEPLTPLSDRFLDIIFEYSKPSIYAIFKDVQDIKNYILQNSFESKFTNVQQSFSNQNQENQFNSGTDYFFCNLIVNIEKSESDIIFNHSETLKNDQNIFNKENNLDKSLLKNLQFQYIDFPAEVQISINQIQLKIENPFREIIQYVINDEKLAIKGQQQKFRFWVIAESAIIKAYKNPVNNHDENQTSIEQILQQFEGIMIFKGNEFIMKDNICQPGGWNLEGINISQILNQLRPNQEQNQNDDSFIKYMKVTLENLNSQNLDRLHGIIMIDDSIDDYDVLKYDGQGISDANIINQIRNEIWKAYLNWKIEMISFEMPLYASNETQQLGLKSRKSQLQAAKLENKEQNLENQNEFSQQKRQKLVESSQNQNIQKDLDQDDKPFDENEIQNIESYMDQTNPHVMFMNMAQAQYHRQQLISAQQAQFQSMGFQPSTQHSSDILNDPEINQLLINQQTNPLMLFHNHIQQLQPITQEPYLTQEQFNQLSDKEKQIYIFQMQQPIYMFGQNQEEYALKQDEILDHKVQLENDFMLDKDLPSESQKRESPNQSKNCKLNAPFSEKDSQQIFKMENIENKQENAEDFFVNINEN